MVRIPRYRPDAAFPTYAYVPGRDPHPVSDPRGHSYGRGPVGIAAPDPKDPAGSPEFLYGVDLFNHGYYWEAHEAWEALWLACGRTGSTADFLKGLIKLAAAGVKAREGRASGVRRHAERAAELFGEAAIGLGGGTVLGLEVKPLIEAAKEIAASPPVDDDRPADGKPVFAVRLMPEASAGRGACGNPALREEGGENSFLET